MNVSRRRALAVALAAVAAATDADAMPAHAVAWARRAFPFITSPAGIRAGAALAIAVYGLEASPVERRAADRVMAAERARRRAPARRHRQALQAPA